MGAVVTQARTVLLWALVALLIRFRALPWVGRVMGGAPNLQDGKGVGGLRGYVPYSSFLGGGANSVATVGDKKGSRYALVEKVHMVLA